MAMITAEVAGATSKIFPFRCWTIATGAPKEDLAFNTSGIAAKYTISGSTPTTITLVTATQGTFTSGGLVVVNADAGEYEIHLPNAALSSTGRVSVAIYDTTATQVFVCEPIYIDVVGVDPRSASAVSANVTQWSGTNVATVDAAGYPKVTVKSGTGAGEISVTSGVVSSNLAQILGTALTETAGQISAGFKQFFNIASPTSTMNTITTVTTATNLTNAPTAGDLTATMKTSVKTQITDALNVDTYAEPSSVPAATTTLVNKIGFLMAKARNKVTQTATTQLVRNDADAATIATSTVSDDGTTFTRGKFV